MTKVNTVKYKEMLLEAAVKKGLRPDVAEAVTDCMVETDKFGIFTHGSINIGKYIRKAEAGGLKFGEDPRVIEEGLTWARLDGMDNFGMFNGRFAMDKAIEKAEKYGMGMVTVNRSGHCGAISNYTVYGAKKGYLCFGMSNAVKLMCVPGAKGNVIGNSPISYAVPRKAGHPIFMDVALSEVAKLKVVKYQREGKPVPDGWCVDKDGVPTNHPVGNEFSLLPMSNHKGYCMAFLVEVLTTVLSGGTFDVRSWLFSDPQTPSELSHTMIAIDVGKMMDPALFEERLAQYTEEITGAPKAVGSDKIFYPGEPNWILYDKAEKEGLELPADVEESVRQFLSENGFSLEACKEE